MTLPSATSRARRAVTLAACVWAVAFAAPHTWWALGIPYGFPGGEANHRLMMDSAWRYIYDVVVVVMSALAIAVALELVKPPAQVRRRWVPYASAWLACGMLSLRGLAGMVVDWTSDPVWWPTFLLGGILFGAVAWMARRPSGVPQAPLALRS